MIKSLSHGEILLSILPGFLEIVEKAGRNDYKVL